MHLTSLDWAIVIATLLLCLVPALLFMRRGTKSTAEFFASGRSAPWWLIGLSMVATTFAADTPNFVAQVVRQEGVGGNWRWWSFLITGMTTVFIYARLWRRSGVMTDLEFYEIRYSGKPASAVRAFRSVYLGLMYNCFIMANVNLAIVKIAQVLLGWSATQTLEICGALALLYALPSGLWGVLMVDTIQFGIKMTAAIFAAYYALQQPQVGGLHGLVTRLPAAKLSFFPEISNHELLMAAFVLPLLVQWWSSWYPGAEPGGGSYIAQRMLAARTEKDALNGTLFFNFAHYALRPWPWILVGLASVLVYPTLNDLRAALPGVDPAIIKDDIAYSAMLRFLPRGIAGLMVGGLAAAYLSTIITHLNWGTSYLVHDCYRRFLRPGRTESHYIWTGRFVTVGLLLVAAWTTFQLSSAKETFNLLLSMGAGTGSIYLLRWFWWRVNAWSEIAAMIASLVFAVGFYEANQHGLHWTDNETMIASVAGTTVVWLAVAFLAPPTDQETLKKFYTLIRPAGPGWRKIREATGLPASTDNLPSALLAVALVAIAVWSTLFAMGSVLYHNMGQAVGLTVLAAVCAYAGLKLGIKTDGTKPE